VSDLTERLIETLSRVEMTLDFPEDDVPLIESAALAGSVAEVSDAVTAILASSAGRTVFAEEPRVGLIGRTNVGKSSLFNRLAGRDDAIVADVHGTTRDTLEAEIDLGGTRLLLVDTAGEKTASSDLDDSALARARQECERAEVVVLVIDASRPLDAVDAALLAKLTPSAEGGSARGFVVLNKTDLGIDAATDALVRSRVRAVAASCVAPGGVDRVRDELRSSLVDQGASSGAARFLLNVRQLDSLRTAGDALRRAEEAANDDIGLEFAAADIRAAVNHLRELTFPLDPEELLDRIFSRFCIGK
jgi:tRNA modification GTPase